MNKFVSEWERWEPETPQNGTDNADNAAPGYEYTGIVSAVSSEKGRFPSLVEIETVCLICGGLASDGDSNLVRDDRDSENRPPFPFMLGTEPYLPAAHAELIPTEGVELVVLGYNLGQELPTLRGRVLDRNGNQVASMDLDLLGRSPTAMRRAERLLTRFRPEGLPAGEYRLNVSIDDLRGRRRAAEMPFEIAPSSAGGRAGR